jgi:hypothetical protein
MIRGPLLILGYRVKFLFIFLVYLTGGGALFESRGRRLLIFLGLCRAYPLRKGLVPIFNKTVLPLYFAADSADMTLTPAESPQIVIALDGSSEQGRGNFPRSLLGR